MSGIVFLKVHITNYKLSFARTIHKKKKNDRRCFNQRQGSRDENSEQHKVVRAKKKREALCCVPARSSRRWALVSALKLSHTNRAQSPRFLKTSWALQQNCQAIRVNCWPVGTIDSHLAHSIPLLSLRTFLLTLRWNDWEVVVFFLELLRNCSLQRRTSSDLIFVHLLIWWE